MKQLLSTSRNLYISMSDIMEEKAKPIAVAELIFAYTDGKDYSINEVGEVSRKTKVSEARIFVKQNEIKELIKYLSKIEKDLEKFDTGEV